ncbi:MAG TPA: glycosyltransferase [Capillimicrobium sp.]|nr:glycosyltransferase [Capillimicrobium sp.]
MSAEPVYAAPRPPAVSGEAAVELRPEALAAAQERAAPPSNLALAARRFGSRYPQARRDWPRRLAGVLLMAAMLAYLPWMFTHLSAAHPWLAWPFAAASVLSAICLTVSVINGWTSRVTPPRPLRGDDVPAVAVIVPTCGEPVEMVLRTVLSVRGQDYPADRLVVVVSDDAHNPELRRAVDGLGVIYHEPPPLHAPGRDGAPKSGNLNSAMALIRERFPDVAFVETRDADDEVGVDDFLRQTVGQLVADGRLAFVQTVKEAQVSAGDPFCNLDGQFYQGQMLTRNAANATFPCGSGLVWRRAALDDIGDFPTWNLVEDLQSGVEALRRGWRGCYLPIVGAVGQHSPEDVANIVKQRGTWAIDTVRLMLWGRKRGLSLRQRLQFSETALFYAHSFTVLVYVPCTALACVSLLPLDASPVQCLVFLMPYALIGELRLLLLNEPFADRRRRQRHPLRALWRLKVIWIGLAPVYMLACAKALAGGPRRKPVYRVTRKTTHVRWYWRETLVQAALAACVPAGFAVGVAADALPSPLVLISAGYWGVMNSAALGGFVTRGWFGLSLAPLVLRALGRPPRPEPDPALALLGAARPRTSG